MFKRIDIYGQRMASMMERAIVVRERGETFYELIHRPFSIKGI